MSLLGMPTFNVVTILTELSCCLKFLRYAQRYCSKCWMLNVVGRGGRFMCFGGQGESDSDNDGHSDRNS